MGVVLLLRHGETTANAKGILAGRLAGVLLNQRGHEQATLAAQRMSLLPIVGIVSSPLERTRETARYVRAEAAPGQRVVVDRGLLECDYGQWSGRKLSSLQKEPLWRDIQHRPSQVVFPGGEAMAGMAARAVATIKKRDAQLAAVHGPGAVWVAVSHGDVIKAILADALGMHLDSFQRIHVAPGSISAINYAPGATSVVTVNSTSDLSALARRPAAGQVGGGR